MKHLFNYQFNNPCNWTTFQPLFYTLHLKFSHLYLFLSMSQSLSFYWQVFAPSHHTIPRDPLSTPKTNPCHLFCFSLWSYSLSYPHFPPEGSLYWDVLLARFYPSINPCSHRIPGMTIGLFRTNWQRIFQNIPSDSFPL